MDITPVGKKAVALKTGDTPLEYHMLSGKRSDCFNIFRQMLLRCEGLVLNLRVFNDGVVLRKITDGTDPEISYIIPDGQKRWSQNLRTDYEGFYPMRTEARSGSYGYPLLTEYADGLFGLISESDVQHGMSGSHLEVRDDNAYHIKYMSEGESENGISPAFVLIIGSLADIVESTLVTGSCRFGNRQTQHLCTRCPDLQFLFFGRWNGGVLRNLLSTWMEGLY
jgi:hypothetical protein